jgi:hypothetical protein
MSKTSIRQNFLRDIHADSLIEMVAGDLSDRDDENSDTMEDLDDPFLLRNEIISTRYLVQSVPIPKD